MGGHSSAAFDLNPPSSNGEGNEGDEEEDREQDCQGQDEQGVGAPWLQGEDRWWLDSEGPDQEQARPRCEQEAERQGQGQPLGCCLQEGTCRAEDQGLLCHQEGYTTLCQGEGVLQGLNTLALEEICDK